MGFWRGVGYFFGVLMIIGSLFGDVNSQDQTLNVDEFNIILLYCYQHADRPNPVQDLVDKGLVSSEFAGETCGSVKQAYDEEQTRIREEIENRTAALEDTRLRYQDCMADHDNKYTEECEDIAKGPYFECLAQGKLFSECFEIYEDVTSDIPIK